MVDDLECLRILEHLAKDSGKAVLTVWIDAAACGRYDGIWIGVVMIVVDIDIVQELPRSGIPRLPGVSVAKEGRPERMHVTGWRFIRSIANPK